MNVNFSIKWRCNHSCNYSKTKIGISPILHTGNKMQAIKNMVVSEMWLNRLVLLACGWNDPEDIWTCCRDLDKWIIFLWQEYRICWKSTWNVYIGIFLSRRSLRSRCTRASQFLQSPPSILQTTGNFANFMRGFLSHNIWSWITTISNLVQSEQWGHHDGAISIGLCANQFHATIIYPYRPLLFINNDSWVDKTHSYILFVLSFIQPCATVLGTLHHISSIPTRN